MSVFFFNDTATTEIYTLSLHDALPICELARGVGFYLLVGERVYRAFVEGAQELPSVVLLAAGCYETRSRPVSNPDQFGAEQVRSEEHTSELQSRQYLVCRLLLEKKNPT